MWNLREQQCISPVLTVTGYDNINLLCENDPASSHHWTVRARWVNWINIYGSMTCPILFTVHQLKWVCGPNVGGNGSKNNSQPKKKQNGCIRRPIWINYILGEYFVPVWIWYQLLLFNNLTGGNLVWPRHPEDLEQLQNLQRDKDRNIATQHMSPNTER